MSDIISEFTAAMRHYGLTAPARIIADGKIHRFRSGPEHGENGFYSLSILAAHQGDDIGFGLIGCWKRDIREKWCSREPKSITDRDRAAMEKVRQEQREADAKAAEEAAKKAKWIWDKAKAANPSHPYLKAKSIDPRGLKEYKDLLVVPVYREGKLTSLQFIAADGRKRFLGGGQIDGGYTSISDRDQARDRIVIAEGYATAASLHAVTGLPVVVAFNAGNLLPVAKAIREKYPEARITIGADNDQWTVIKGKPLNVGIEKAKAAADAIGARVSWPLFDASDPEEPSDWNDYHRRFGLEKTADAFDGRNLDPVWGDNEPPPMEQIPIDAYESAGKGTDRQAVGPTHRSDDSRRKADTGEGGRRGASLPFRR